MFPSELFLRVPLADSNGLWFEETHQVSVRLSRRLSRTLVTISSQSLSDCGSVFIRITYGFGLRLGGPSPDPHRPTLPPFLLN